MLAASFEQRVAAPGFTGGTHERGEHAAHRGEGSEREGVGGRHARTDMERKEDVEERK